MRKRKRMIVALDYDFYFEVLPCSDDCRDQYRRVVYFLVVYSSRDGNGTVNRIEHDQELEERIA
jgi:hypothetical protein